MLQIIYFWKVQMKNIFPLLTFKAWQLDTPWKYNRSGGPTDVTLTDQVNDEAPFSHSPLQSTNISGKYRNSQAQICSAR